MTERRPTRQQIRQANLGKTVLLLFLGAVIVWLWLERQNPAQEAVREPLATIVVVESTAVDEEAAAVAPSIPTPFLTIPKELKAGTVILSGVAELPGATVEVLVDDKVVGQTTVKDNNTWTLAAEIKEGGPHRLTTRVYEGRGEERTLIYDDSIEILVRTPTSPRLIITGQEQLRDGSLSLRGEALPLSTVEILLGGEVVGTAVADEQGLWLFEYADARAGSYELRLRMVDEAGTLLGESEPSTLVLEEPAAVGEAPTVDLTGSLPLLRPSATVTLTGTAAPQSIVAIVINGTIADNATVTAAGTWSQAVTLPDDDQIVLTIQTIDDGGAILAESEPVTISLTEAPQPFEVLESQLNTQTAELALSGTATPGSQVIVIVEGEVLAFAFVDEGGEWAIMVDLPTDDVDELEIENRSAEGDIVLGSAVIPVTDDVAAEATAVQESTAPTETPAGGLSSHDLTITSPAANSTVEGTYLRLLGTGPARRQIELLQNGVVVGQTTIPDSGIWRYTLPADDGEQLLSVRLLYDEESEIEPIRVMLNRPLINPACANPTPGQDLGDRYIVGDCEWLTWIAARLGISYWDLLQLNPELQDNPNILRPGQVLILPPRGE